MSSVLSEAAETRIVLENVSWETFVALADERRGSIPRMKYNEGALETTFVRAFRSETNRPTTVRRTRMGNWERIVPNDSAKSSKCCGERPANSEAKSPFAPRRKRFPTTLKLFRNQFQLPFGCTGECSEVAAIKGEDGRNLLANGKMKECNVRELRR